MKGHTVVLEGTTYVCDGTVSEKGHLVYQRATGMPSTSLVQQNTGVTATSGASGATGVIHHKTAAQVSAQNLARRHPVRIVATTSATTAARPQPSAQATGSDIQGPAQRPERGKEDVNALKPLVRTKV